MPMKTDCFAFRSRQDEIYCTVLNTMTCAKRKCRFYRTKEQFEAAAQKAAERLEMLKSDKEG